LQASKQATNQKVLGRKAQDPMTLIQELIKALSLFANSRVDLQSNPSRNSNSLSTSKNMLIQKACLK